MCWRIFLCNLPYVLVFVGALSAQTTRPFSMSSTAVQAQAGQIPLYQNSSAQFTFSAMSADADLIALFPEYLGIPFSAFATSAALPSNNPWSIQMTALASSAKAAGKPLMIEITFAHDAGPQGTTNPTGWSFTCDDFAKTSFAATANAYANYAAWMAKTFSPKYMVVMIEANLYYTQCGGNNAAWKALVGAETQAYNAVKAANPAILAFPSLNLENLYGQTVSGFDQVQYLAFSQMKRDRLGLATYAYGLESGSGFINPYQLPLDYFARTRNRNPSEPRIVITETGWNSTGISVLSQGTCASNFVYSDPSFQAAYLNLLLYSAYVDNFEHVNWWSDRDLIPATVMTTCYPAASAPYAQCNGDKWCMAVNTWRSTSNGWTPVYAELAFKSFGTFGLRQYDGTAKPSSLSLWQRFLAYPIAPH